MKSGFVFTALTVASRLLVGLLLFLLLARLWGPAPFGQFTFVFSVSALLVLIVDFGFSLYVLREVAARRSEATALISEAMAAKMRLAVVCATVALAVALAAGPRAVPPALLLPLLLAALAMSFADFFIAPLRAMGLYKAECALVVAANTLQLTIAGGVAWYGGDTVAVAWTMALSRLVFMCVAGAQLGRILPDLNLRRPLSGRRRGTIGKILPYGLDGVMAVAWTQADVVLVRLLFGQQAVGLYAAGQKIVLGIGALAPVVGNVMIPSMTALVARHSPRFWRMAFRTAALLMCIGLVFALPMILLPDQIVVLLFGPAYRDLAGLLPMFGLVVLVRYAGAGAGVVITAAGLQARRVLAQVAGMCMVALLVPAIPFLGLNLRDFIGIYVAGLSTMAIGYVWFLWRLRAEQASRPQA